MGLKKEHKILIFIGIFYVVYLLLFIGKFNFNPSATIEVSEKYYNYTLNATNNTSVFPHNLIIHQNEGFDGQFYYTMALYPKLDHVFFGSHFLQRAFYPYLALALSFGIKSLLPVTFILINLFSIIFSSYLLILILKKHRANINLVYLWAFNIGFLISVTKNITEPLMVLFIVAMVYFIEQEKHGSAAVFLSFAIITRELALTVWAGIILYFIIKRDFKKVFLYALAIIPFIIWEAFLIYKTGEIPIIFSSFALTIPGINIYSHHISSGIPSYFAEAPSKIQYSIISNGSIFDKLKELNKILSPAPIILFAIIQLIILIGYLYKERKVTKYTILTVSQLAMIFFLDKSLLFLEVDAIGRYAIVLYLFSILYFTERNKEYHSWLITLLIISSFAYFIQRAIIPKGGYWVS